MRKCNTVRKYLTYPILLVLTIFIIGCNKENDLKNLDTKYISASYAVDMNSPEEVVGICSNVFVGYVEEKTDTYYISHFPYTRYHVKVIKNIKGDLPLDTTVYVNKEGGISEDSSCYVLYKNDFLPDEGGYYVFNVRERMEDGSYTASGVNTVILLNDIDMPNDKSNQEETNANIISDDRNELISLDNSAIYQKYVDAYKNQISYDPKR